MTPQLALLAFASCFLQDQPEEIAKNDLPKEGVCVVCSQGQKGHGQERVAAGVRYKGADYYFCSIREVKSFKNDPDSFIPPVLPRPLPALNWKDINGNIWSQESFADRVVLIDFWATWCAPCKEMFPIFDSIVAKYASQKFVLLSVSVDQKKQDFDKYMKKRIFPNPVVLDDKGDFAKLNVRSIPATFLIKNGQIINQWVGKQTESDLRQAIDLALKD